MENMEMDKITQVVGVYGSPRQGGNTDILMDTLLAAIEGQGISVSKVYPRRLKMQGCVECGKCDETGACALKDDMQKVYPLLENASVVILSSPVFFYGVSWQLKALIDRAQALWSKKRLGLLKRRDGFSGGYMISLGATKGKNLFLGVELVAKYFFDALDMRYLGGLFYRGVEKKGEVIGREDILKEVKELGGQIIGQIKGV